MAWGDVKDGVVAAAAGASVTPAYGQATTAGNFLVAYVGANGATAALTCSDGTWTKIGEANSGAGTARSAVFVKPNCGAGEAAPTFTGTGAGNIHALLREFSGGPADTSGITFKTNVSTTGTVTVTLTAADAAGGNLLISCDYNRPANGVVIASADAYNNGATPLGNENNDAANTFHHYRFAYGVTTGNGAADSNATTGWGISGGGNVASILVSIPSAAPATATDSGTVTATDSPTGGETIVEAAATAATGTPAAAGAIADQATLAATAGQTANESIFEAATLPVAAVTPAAAGAIADQAAALLACSFLLAGETISEAAADHATLNLSGVETIKAFESGTVIVIVTPSGYIFVRGRAVALAVATIAKAAGIVTAVRATAPVTGL